MNKRSIKTTRIWNLFVKSLFDTINYKCYNIINNNLSIQRSTKRGNIAAYYYLMGYKNVFPKCLFKLKYTKMFKFYIIIAYLKG